MTVGFTCSSFDLFHTGHVLMLKEVSEQCEYLIVGLQTDPTIDREEKNKPIQSVYERFEQLRGCKYIDEIVPYATEEDLYNYLISHQHYIDVRFLGSEYAGLEFTGHDISGIDVSFNTRMHNYSSSELRERLNKE